MLTRLVQFRILIRTAHSSPTAKQNPVIPIFIVFWAVLQLPVLISGCSRVARKKLTKCQVFTGQANGEPKVRRSRLKKCKRSLRAHLLEDETGRQEQNPVIPIFILKIGFQVEPTVSSFTIRCSQCSHGLYNSAYLSVWLILRLRLSKILSSRFLLSGFTFCNKN